MRPIPAILAASVPVLSVDASSPVPLNGAVAAGIAVVVFLLQVRRRWQSPQRVAAVLVGLAGMLLVALAPQLGAGCPPTVKISLIGTGLLLGLGASVFDLWQRRHRLPHGLPFAIIGLMAAMIVVSLYVAAQVLPQLRAWHNVLGAGAAAAIALAVLALRLWQSWKVRQHLRELAQRFNLQSERKNWRTHQVALLGNYRNRPVRLVQAAGRSMDGPVLSVKIEIGLAHSPSVQFLTVARGDSPGKLAASTKSWPEAQFDDDAFDTAFQTRATDADLTRDVCSWEIRRRLLDLRQQIFFFGIHEGKVLLALSGSLASTTLIERLEEKLVLASDLAEAAEAAATTRMEARR